ncbi:ABC transporter [Thermoactinomyces sp. DSM 45891]|nr:ABC transporter [Thermoactinomyces sp. DSM 45891]
MLQVQQLNKIYTGKVATKALVDINLTIDQGEFVGIMGPSGSGKTTLLNMDTLTIAEKIRCEDNRQQFFQEIIDMLSLLGGDNHELSSVRI